MSSLKEPGSGGAQADHPQLMGTRVLLVSDEPDSGRIWAFALQQMGLEVVLTSRSEDALEKWATAGFDLLIIDLFFGDELLSQQDISSLKTKDNGGSRLVIAYMSIGEAEDYRYYWDPEWNTSPPEWLEEENPNWQGNYKVRYWYSEWQSIIFGNETSYSKRIIDAGFDGVYLDIIDAFEYFESQ